VENKTMLTGSKWNSARRWILVVVCVFHAPLALVTAANAVLDFENLPAGTTVTTQYLSRGVRFASAFLTTHPAARSGTRVLRTVSPNAEVFTPIPFKIEFLAPQRHVQLFAMSPAIARNGTLRAFDVSGAVIAKDGPKLVAADKFTTRFKVNVPVARIRRVELRLDGASHFAIDDLKFGTSPLTAEPLVELTETRQPAARDNVAVTGKFPAEFPIGPPPASAASGSPAPQDDAEKDFEIEGAPPVEKDLEPGASAELVKHVAGAHGFLGSVRWIGTAGALRVKLSLNGSTLAAGKTYALGGNRGGANVSGVANTAGDVKLSVTNTSGVRVKVRLILSFIPKSGQ
jgi:hypothetical protein